MSAACEGRSVVTSDAQQSRAVVETIHIRGRRMFESVVVRKRIPVADIAIVIGVLDLPLRQGLQVREEIRTHSLRLSLVGDHVAIVKTVNLKIEIMTMLPVQRVSFLGLFLFPGSVFIQN